MVPVKTLPQREKELRFLLATAEGQKELHELEFRYQAENGRTRPTKTSLITYIIVYERELGLIS